MISKIFRQFGRKSRTKIPKLRKGISGFTLIELLVALVMASIIVSSLLTFLVSVLDTDRKEQVKAESQEEIQSALNFIADDLQQAVYIYDADGLYIPSAAAAPLPPLPPLQQRIVDQIPSGPTLTPVLVFWKRNDFKRADKITTSGDQPSYEVGCLEFPSNSDADCFGTVPLTTPIETAPKGRDKFVFSLVAYYLVKDTTPSSTWSNAARIARWEIRDGIRWACNDGRLPTETPPSACPNTDFRLRIDGLPTSGLPLYDLDLNRYAVFPDNGFIRFDASGSGTLSDRMNRWRIGSTPTPNQTLTVLLDYVDDTPYIPAQDNPGVSPIKIGLLPNTPPTGATFPLTTQSRNTACDRADTGVGVGLTDAQLGTAAQTVFSQRIPPDFGSAIYNPIPSRPSSFYACVNARQVVARVYIRGNALARLEPNPNFRTITDDKRASFVPTASVRAFGRGAIGIEQ